LSALFSGLAAHNVVARILYAMGREGALPRTLGRTHAVHRTPHVAIVVNLVLMAAVAAVIVGASSQTSRDAVGASPGPLSSGFYLFAEGVTISTPLAMVCFMLMSVAGLRFGLKTGGSRLGMGRRLAVAAGSLLASTVGLGGSLYYSFAELMPGGGIPGPYRAVPLVGALLVAVGGVLALTLRTRKPDVWRRMGALFN
jgi:amino acid transporter